MGRRRAERISLEATHLGARTYGSNPPIDSVILEKCLNQLDALNFLSVK